MALTRKYSDRTSEKTGPETWAGTIVFVCPEVEALGHVSALHDSPMPEIGGEHPPLAKLVRAHHNAEPGFAWIVARYMTTRQPGEARLIGHLRSRDVKMKVDLDGKIITGPVGDGIHWYKVWTGANNVPGTNIIPQGVEMCMLKTAIEADDFDLRATRADRGTINAQYLPNFGQAPPGSLLFWDFKYDWKWGESLWYVDYLFMVCPYHDESGNVLSWNDTLYAQKCVSIVQEVPVFDPVAGLPIDQWATTGEMVRQRDLVPGFHYQRISDENVLKPVAPEKRRPFRTADWSNLDAMIRW